MSLFVSLCVILLVLINYSICSDSVKPGFFNASVGPFGLCYGKKVNLESSIRECFERCHRPPQPRHASHITLYQVNEAGKGPEMIECHGVELSQTFTKTWTFSTIKSEITQTLFAPTRDSCTKKISEKCSGSKCNIRPPTELEEDYTYGATVKKTEKHLSLISVPSSFSVYGSDVRVIPMTSQLSYQLSRGEGSDGVKWYFWDKTHPVDECPFEAASTHGCDHYANSDDEPGRYLCSHGGFSLTPTGPMSTSIPKCAGILTSREGLLYKVSSLPLDPKGQRIGLVNAQYQQVDAEALRGKINHIINNLDSDLCLVQCEMLSLEARIVRDQPKMLKVGSDLILIHPNGSSESCAMSHGCHVVKPHLMCGNPPRFGISCTGVGMLWDPLMPYATMYNTCSRPSRFEKMQITAGHHIYNVDDSLTMEAPAGFMHGKIHDMFTVEHMTGLQFQKEDVDQLKTAWISAKTESTESEGWDVKTDVESQTFFDKIGNSFGKMFGWISDGINVIHHFIAIVLIAIVIYSSWKLYVLITSRPQLAARYIRTPAYDNTRRDTGRIEWVGSN